MNSTKLFCTTLASALVLASGCKKEEAKDTAQPAAKPAATVAPAKNPNEVVAAVNDAKLLRKDLDALVNAFLSARQVPAEQIEAARNSIEPQIAASFIPEQLLLQEAKKKGVTMSADEIKAEADKLDAEMKKQNTSLEAELKKSPFGEALARQKFEENLLIRKFLENGIFKNITAPAEEVAKLMAEAKKNYDEAQKKFEEATSKLKNLDAVKAAARLKIEGLRKQIIDGGDFAELAKANSDCPSGQKGGDLGEFPRGNMVKPFEDAAFSQEVGKVGDIVETQFGYHLIKVTAKSPAAPAKGDQPAKPETVTASHILVKVEQQQPQQPQPMPTMEQVTNYLKGNAQREAIQKYLEVLKSQAKVINIFEPEAAPSSLEATAKAAAQSADATAKDAVQQAQGAAQDAVKQAEAAAKDAAQNAEATAKKAIEDAKAKAKSLEATAKDAAKSAEASATSATDAAKNAAKSVTLPTGK